MEALEGMRIGGEAGRKYFYGDIAAEAKITSAINFTHPASTEEMDESIGTETEACGEDHRAPVAIIVKNGSGEQNRRSSAHKIEPTGALGAENLHCGQRSSPGNLTCLWRITAGVPTENSVQAIFDLDRCNACRRLSFILS